MNLVMDTGPLLLLSVGRSDLRYIAAHRRLQEIYYSVEYFLVVDAIVEDAARVILPPHVLAEVSNLASYIKEPASSHIRATFGEFVSASDENYVPSVVAVANFGFRQLGSTDAAVLAICETEIENLALITADRPLADRVRNMGRDVFLLPDL